MLRIGKGHEITLENQLISFEANDFTELNYFQIIQKFSIDVYLGNILVMAIPLIK
jgi:hypothetical protein